MKNSAREKYKILMKKCLSLALKSKGQNLPNPYVGAILYDEDVDRIVSCGYHQKFGLAHAEVNAINCTKDPKGKVLIVNLEPCSHHGKTPPCCDLIIKSGIKKVVAAMADPNKKVNGEGIKKLKEAGVEVVLGVLEEEAKDINKIFIKNQTANKPYVMLKTATTLDSKIALQNKKSKWITSEKSRYYVQKLRSQYQAIMSASGTILADNPRLDVRLKGKASPIRIIFDPNNKLDFSFNVFKNDGIRVILVNNTKLQLPPNVERIDFSDFHNLFLKLYSMGIYSIMVEAGQGLNSSLIEAGEVDEINQFIAPKLFGSGFEYVKLEETDEIDSAIELYDVKIKKIADDILYSAKIKKRRSKNENPCNKRPKS